MAKLFLDHKTLYYDVVDFLFYVLCEVGEDGCARRTAPGLVVHAIQAAVEVAPKRCACRCWRARRGEPVQVQGTWSARARAESRDEGRAHAP
jgi:hypothetical protein